MVVFLVGLLLPYYCCRSTALGQWLKPQAVLTMRWGGTEGGEIKRGHISLAKGKGTKFRA